MTGKYKRAAHFSCNSNLKLNKKIPVIFHDLRGKFDVKVSVTPNELEKYMAFTVNKNLVFIDSKQFMNSGLDSLVKNLSNNDFKYFSEESSRAIATSHRRGELLELVKEKGVYPYDHMDSFERFPENKLPDKSKFFSSLKDECISEKITKELIMSGMRSK